MLFRKPFKLRIRAGEVTLSFRAWARPQVRIGEVYNIHPFGAIQVDALERTRLSKVTLRDAERAGFESVEALRAEISKLGLKVGE